MGLASALGRRLRRGSQAMERQSDNRAIYLIGEPGYPNFGDELIAREWLRYLAKRCPGREIILDCARPGPAAMVLRGVHPHVTFTDTLRRLGTENPFPYDGPIDDIAGFVAEALDDEGMAPQYAAGIRALHRDVAAVHMLGGGYMRGDWTCNLSRLSIGPWAEGRGIPAVATGLGLMPLTGGSLDFARRSAAAFRTFTVRDERTMETLNAGPAGMIASLAPDDCFVNGLEGCYMEGEALPGIMLCIQSDFVDAAEALHAHVERMLESWGVAHDDPIGVVECNPRIDRPIFDYLGERGYNRLRFFPVAEVLERGFPACAGQRWISTRYHPHILAAALGCRGAFVSVDAAYYDVKHAAVLRMGSHWSAAPIGGAIPEAGSGFDDPNTRFKYARSIRASVEGLYAPLVTTME